MTYHDVEVTNDDQAAKVLVLLRDEPVVLRSTMPYAREIQCECGETDIESTIPDFPKFVQCPECNKFSHSECVMTYENSKDADYRYMCFDCRYEL